MSQGRIDTLVEKIQKLNPEDGYYGVSSQMFAGYTELDVISAAKQAGATVRWSNYEKEMIVIPQ